MLVGLLAGSLSGLFGVGGGVLIVPGLVLIMGLDQRRAHGTSLAAIVPIALSGVAGFSLEDSVDWAVAAVLIAGSTVGAALGTAALRRLPTGTLRLAFAGLLLATAARMAVAVPEGMGRGDLDAGTAVGLAAVGLVSGTLAGLLGVGGGVIMVPAQVLLFSIPDAVAKGTSLAVIVPTAIVGTIRNARHGNALLPVATAVGLSGVVSAFAASMLAVRLDPELSAMLFAGLLVVTALRMLRTHLRDGRPAPG